MNRQSTEPVPLKLPQRRSRGGFAYSEDSGIWLSKFSVRSSIRSKLLIAFVVVSILAVSTVSFVSYFVAKDVVSDTVMNGLRGVATHQTRQVELELDHLRKDLKAIRTDTQVRQSLRHYIATADYIDRFVLNQIMTDRAEHDSEIIAFDIHDSAGYIVASSEPGHLGTSDFDPSTSGFVIVPNTGENSGSVPELRLSGAIEFDGRTIGFATAHISGNFLNEIGTAYIGLRDTGETLLVSHDTDGKARYISPLRFDHNNTLFTPISGSPTNRVELRALSGNSGESTELIDYRGETVFSVYQYVDDADIGVVIKMDQTEALYRLSGFIRALGFIIAIVIIGVIVTALLMARQLAHPITELTRSADLFSRGRLDSRVEVNSSDEIGILADTFNGMAASIQSANTELEERVKERTADLKRSNQDLEQFAYVASHDLQEPLRMVTSYTQLLARRYQDQLDDDANEFINFAVDGASRMRDLINDLLTYSRVGRHNNQYVEVDTVDIVSDAMKNLGQRMEEENVSVSIGELPVVVADRTQLVSLFQNLISNAIKYRDSERQPWVEITAERMNSAWRFAVTDNGIGIDPKFSERIFTIFQRLHSREKYQGTGIGLAVARKIIERAGGTIWVDSKTGEGATFFFTLIDKSIDSNTDPIQEGNQYSVAS